MRLTPVTGKEAIRRLHHAGWSLNRTRSSGAFKASYPGFPNRYVLVPPTIHPLTRRMMHDIRAVARASSTPYPL